jgi:hypothetical protein
MPFESLSKRLKKNFKNIISGVNYGDDHRLPLVYLETYSTQPSSYYAFPKEIKDKPLAYYQTFPKLSVEILVALFSAIGVRYVPEITLAQLETKTPRRAFEDFCMTFGEEEGLINSFVLNRIIGRLQKMDGLRTQEPFDSRAVYRALSYRDLEEVDRLIGVMRALNNEKER